MPQQECEHLYTKKVCGKLQTVKETYWSDRNAWIQTVHEETVRAFTVNTSGEGAEADATRVRGGAHPGQVASLLQSQHRETDKRSNSRSHQSLSFGLDFDWM